MFSNLFKNNTPEKESKDDDDTPMLNLTYKKIPMTLELKKRQNEERLREKYKIPKEKKGVLL